MAPQERTGPAATTARWAKSYGSKIAAHWRAKVRAGHQFADFDARLAAHPAAAQTARGLANLRDLSSRNDEVQLLAVRRELTRKRAGVVGRLAAAASTHRPRLASRQADRSRSGGAAAPRTSVRSPDAR